MSAPSWQVLSVDGVMVMILNYERRLWLLLSVALLSIQSHSIKQRRGSWLIKASSFNLLL
jgi:hypothetical protein